MLDYINHDVNSLREALNDACDFLYNIVDDLGDLVDAATEKVVLIEGAEKALAKIDEDLIPDIELIKNAVAVALNIAQENHEYLDDTKETFESILSDVDSSICELNWISWS